MNETSLPRVEQAEDELKDTLLEITSILLDNYYEDKPHSNAYGVEYTGDYNAEFQSAEDDDLIPHGIWFLGRADGADGAEKDCGVDYIVRKHPDPDGRRGDDERHYLFGDYGWPRYIDDFRVEVDIYRNVVESGIEDEYLTEAHLERFNLAIDRFEEALRADRHDTSLDEVAEALKKNNMDFLRPVLVEDSEDGRNIWQLLFSKNEDGDIVENDVDVPVVSNADGLIFAHTERLYIERDYRGNVSKSKKYSFGVVIGIDDTDEVFFVHRLQSDTDLRGDLVTEDVKQLQESVDISEDDVREKQEEKNISRLTAEKRLSVLKDLLENRGFDMDEWEAMVEAKREAKRPEWTAAMVKEKMGFDLDYDDLVGDSVPLDTTVRVQGDLALQRHDYRTVLWEYYDDVFQQKRLEAARGRRNYDPIEDDEKEYNPWVDFLEAHPRFNECTQRQSYRDDGEGIDKLTTISTRPQFSISGNTSTDELKQLQDVLDISEEDVRDEQEKRGISRLSASKRRELIQDILIERSYEWMYKNSEGMPSREELQKEAEIETRNEFEDVDKQVNRALGNHAVMIGPAREHPNRQFGDQGTLAAIVVPERATLVVWHDEHSNVKAELAPGVYEFRFLEGHEDGWWRPGW